MAPRVCTVKFHKLTCPAMHCRASLPVLVKLRKESVRLMQTLLWSQDRPYTQSILVVYEMEPAESFCQKRCLH